MSKDFLKEFCNVILQAELGGKNPTQISHLGDLPDHNICLARAALEQKFNKKFMYDEVKTLLKEVYNYPPDTVYIPQWYKDKWFQ